MELLPPLELSRILKLHPFTPPHPAQLLGAGLPGGAGFTVTRLAREGKLPDFKVGGVWRFRKDEFERWIAARTSKNRRTMSTRR